MQATESYIGSEQRLDVPLLEKESQEMQDVHSRRLQSVYRRAYRYLGNAANAEQTVQDALLSACKHLDQFKGQAKMSTWRLMQFVEELLPSLHKAYQLRDLDGLSTSEAAHNLGVIEGTLEGPGLRARAELRRLMRRALAEEPRSALTHYFAGFVSGSKQPSPVPTRQMRHQIAMESCNRPWKAN